MVNEPTNPQNNDSSSDNDLEKITPNDLLKFADTFNHKKTQKLISETINGLIRQAVKSDCDTRTELKKIIKELEKEDWKILLKKFGFMMSNLFGVVITFILTRLVHC